MPLRKPLVLLAGLLLLPALSQAEPTPGHSQHGEVFNEGPRQKAHLMANTGRIQFPITCKSTEAQQFFNQGVGQLHGFWYFEAERSFRQVAALEPGCGMAYWGMAMANFENPTRAQGFIQKAVANKKSLSRREQLYIDGLAAYLQGKGDLKARRQAYLKSLDTICLDFPDDVEARAFLVVRSWQFRNEVPIPSYQAMDSLLDQIFAANPLHPAHHYRIHLWDGVRPTRALGSAAKSGLSSPSIAHMWHMAGHTYSGLQRYAEAAWEQEASSRVDHFHMMADRVLPDQIHNYAHNQEWLIRDLSHIGRARDAVALAMNMIELPRHPKYNTATRGSARYGRVRLQEVLERYEMWDDVLALADTQYLEPGETADQQVGRLRLIGLAHAGKGQRAALEEVIDKLEARTGRKAERAPQPRLVGDAPARSTPSKGPAGSSNAKAKGAKGSGPSLQDTIAELRASAALLAGDAQEALTLARSIRTLSKARLARFHLEAGDTGKAVEIAKQQADQAKNQVVPLAHYVEMLHHAGKAKEAGEAFQRLRGLSAHIDSLEHPCFRRLAPVAQALNLPADWRQVVAWPKDRGERPPIETLGPLHWQPTPAPSWTLPTQDGRPLALADYRGRPVLVIFYLGHGCVHCLEQLNLFAPRARDFADAGINIVAISSDSLDELKKSQAGSKDGAEFPFPLLADPKLETFRAYRAYDDFEDMPLHGTFLIDGQGLVRWHDISYQPFTDAEFVLREAKRLLAFPSKLAGR